MYVERMVIRISSPILNLVSDVYIKKKTKLTVDGAPKRFLKLRFLE